jgi:hypothetical protein
MSINHGRRDALEPERAVDGKDTRRKHASSTIRWQAGVRGFMVDPIAPPRAVLSASVRLLYRVLGEERLGTARGNAWEAVCADRKRADDRARVQLILRERAISKM